MIEPLNINVPRDHTVYFYRNVVRAVEILAISSGDMKYRLFRAAGELMLIFPECIHEDLRKDIVHIREQLTRYKEDNTRSAVKNTVWKNKNTTREKIASKILDLFFKYQHHIENITVIKNPYPTSDE